MAQSCQRAGLHVLQFTQPQPEMKHERNDLKEASTTLSVLAGILLAGKLAAGFHNLVVLADVLTFAVGTNRGQEKCECATLLEIQSFGFRTKQKVALSDRTSL